MGKSSGGPAPGESVQAAMMTAASNLQAQREATDANRINQYTPWGNLIYDKTPGAVTYNDAAYQQALQQYNRNIETVTDENGNTQTINHNGSNPAPTREQYAIQGTPTWSQRVELTPEMQEALNAQNQISANQSNLALLLQQRVKDEYSKAPYNPQLADYLKDVGKIDQSTINFSDYLKDVPGLDYNAPELAGYMNGTKDLITDQLKSDDYTKDALALDQNAPVLDEAAFKKYADAYYKQADVYKSQQYSASEQAQRDALALQGLTPGSQAVQGAMGSFYDAKARDYSALEQSAILNGSQMANNDYASKLAGFNATNNARTQTLNNGLARYAADLSGIQSTNAARTTDVANRLSTYGAALQGYQAKNATAQQGFTNANTSYNAALQSQQSRNNAVNQAYAQAVNRYGAEYDAYQQNRSQSLNEMNALLSGQQVNAPTFNGYYMQGNAGGVDYSGAVKQDSANALAAQNASNANAMNTAKGLAAAGTAAAVGTGAVSAGAGSALAALAMAL